MKVFEIIRALIFTLPFGIFTTFGVFTLLTCAMKVRRIDAVLRRLLGFYFTCATFSGLLLLAYYYSQAVFVWFDIVYCGLVVYTIVLFYHILCYAVQSEKRFCPLHYVIPLFACCVLYTTKLFLPGYWAREGYTLLFCVILIFAIVYSLLPLLEIHRFHIKQSLENGTSEVIDRLRAILYILEALMFPVVFGLFPFIGGQNPGIIVSILMMISILIALAMNIPLTYAIIRHYTLSAGDLSLFNSLVQNLTIVQAEDFAGRNGREELLETESKPTKRVYRNYTRKHRSTGQLIEINKAEFESYFRKHKPYLNPYLTISDLIEPLQSNRTYISKFINRIYGMNFNSYVNMCRLRELDRLMSMPGNRHKTPATLFSQAGFSSYRSYLNTQKQLEATNNVKD